MQGASLIELNSEYLRQTLNARGFESIRALAQASGVHRNTVSDYFTGATKPLPDGLEKILLTLKADLRAVLQLRRTARSLPGADLAKLADKLLPLLEGACLVFYGSRARGSFKPYSDYDLGIYRKSAIDFPSFSRMLDVIADWNETQTIEAQLTNLSLADGDFLRTVGKEGHFLTGSMESWKALLQSAGVETYER